MKPSKARILTVNGGSSSIKFALFGGGGQGTRAGFRRRDPADWGLPEADLRVKGRRPEVTKPLAPALGA